MKLPQFSALCAKSKSRAFVAIARFLVVAGPVASVATSIASEPLAKGIQDNSFFIEEAYNQESGVVQHILNVPINFINGSREITPSFTQEWPVFSQMHQFSYTIPYAFTEDDNGMEDMRLNYRVQALTEDKYTPAFAPRFSLVLPTGDPDKDLGVGSVGYETNLPFSKIVSDRWTHISTPASPCFPTRGTTTLRITILAPALFSP